MTWEDYWLARQLLTEERVGSKVRKAAAREEAQAQATIEAIQQTKGR